MKPISRTFWIKIILAPVAMFCFAYALIPLYDVLCEVTGLTGRTGRISIVEAQTNRIDENRLVTVEFLSMTTAGFDVEFKPEVNSMKVVPGKIYEANYIAYNGTDAVITGQAIPSVAPAVAALKFKKIECFCFTKQDFQPKTKVVMPVRFIVQTDLNDKVKDITLSYNFFKLKG